jgi:hypothetical protein
MSEQTPLSEALASAAEHASVMAERLHKAVRLLAEQTTTCVAPATADPSERFTHTDRVFQQDHLDARSLTVTPFGKGELMFHAYEPKDSSCISPVLTRAEVIELRSALDAWLRGAL